MATLRVAQIEDKSPFIYKLIKFLTGLAGLLGWCTVYVLLFLNGREGVDYLLRLGIAVIMWTLIIVFYQTLLPASRIEGPSGKHVIGAVALYIGLVLTLGTAAGYLATTAGFARVLGGLLIAGENTFMLMVLSDRQSKRLEWNLSWFVLLPLVFLVILGIAEIFGLRLTTQISNC